MTSLMRCARHAAEADARQLRQAAEAGLVTLIGTGDAVLAGDREESVVGLRQRLLCPITSRPQGPIATPQRSSITTAGSRIFRVTIGEQTMIARPIANFASSGSARACASGTPMFASFHLMSAASAAFAVADP